MPRPMVPCCRRNAAMYTIRLRQSPMRIGQHISSRTRRDGSSLLDSASNSPSIAIAAEDEPCLGQHCLSVCMSRQCRRNKCGGGSWSSRHSTCVGDSTSTMPMFRPFAASVRHHGPRDHAGMQGTARSDSDSVHTRVFAAVLKAFAQPQPGPHTPPLQASGPGLRTARPVLA